MRHLLVLFALIVLVLEARGQEASPAQPLSVSVTITKQVVGLTFNVTKHAQEATFTVSMTVTDPPPDCTLVYGWSTSDSGGTLAFDDPMAASTTGRAAGTGIFYVTGGVNAYKKVNGVNVLMAQGAASKECAAIGDPITTSVGGNKKPTYNHDKNNIEKSWYMT